MWDDGSGSTERRTFLQSIGAFGSLVAAGGVTAATPGRDPAADRNELVVGTTDDASTADVQSQAVSVSSADTQVTHRNEELGYFTVEVPDGPSTSSTEGLKEELEQREGVAYVEENVTYEIQRAPNDARYDAQYAPQQVNAPAAWETTLGSQDVTVAVVDQGTAYDHTDLQGQFGSDTGKDFVDDDDDPQPDVSRENHGTHVSGCASATTDNDAGVAGVSNSRLLSCRALSERGGGSLTDIADAIQWAADQGVDIINMSLGGGGYTQTMKDAVSYAADNGVLLVCAAGNGSGAPVSYPAAYEECVAVSALDPDENLARFSNKGEKIDVAAPGVNVLSTVPGDGYEQLSGTSMACPVAAGVAALGLAADASLSASELKQRLEDTAVDVGLGETEQGAGRVDAAKIVDAGTGAQPKRPQASIEGPSEATTGDEVTFDGSGSTDPDGGSITSYEWTIDGETKTGSQVSHTFSDAGDFSVDLTVTDDEGQTNSARTTVTVTDSGDGDDGEQGTPGVRAIDEDTIEAVVELDEQNDYVYLHYGVNGSRMQYKQMEHVEGTRYRTTVSGLADGDEVAYEFLYYDGGWQWKHRDSSYTFDPDDGDDGDGGDDGEEGTPGVRAIDGDTIEAVVDIDAQTDYVYFHYGIDGGRMRYQRMEHVEGTRYRTTVDGLTEGDEVRYEFLYYDGGWNWKHRDSSYTFTPDESGGDGGDSGPEPGVRAIDENTLEAVVDTEEQADYVYFHYGVDGSRMQYQRMDNVEGTFYRTTVDGLADGDEVRYEFGYYVDGVWHWKHRDSSYTFDPA